MRGHAALPIGNQHDAAGADRARRGFRLQRLEQIALPRRVDQEHLARQPVDQKGAGPHAGLEDIAPVGDGDFGAEGAVVRVFDAITAGYDGGAEIDIGKARRADACRRARALAVAAARDDGRAGTQSGCRRRRHGHLAHRRAGRDQSRHLRHVDAGGAQDLFGPDVPAHVERAGRIGRCGRRHPMARQPESQIGMHLGDARGAVEDCRLEFSHPHHAIDARDDVQRLARDGVDALRAEALAEALLLRLCPVIKPDHARAQRRAILGKDGEGLALVRNADCGDARGIDLGRHILERERGRSPPILGVLLEIARLRVRHGDGRAAFRDGAARPVPGDRLGGRGGRIDADDKIRVHQCRSRSERRRDDRLRSSHGDRVRAGRHPRPGYRPSSPRRPCTPWRFHHRPGRSAACRARSGFRWWKGQPTRACRAPTPSHCRSSI